ncbi:hypothetical protein C1645_815669 [Glomus cerebriforme]|uniref:Uncharacterized protein n=1 Tax=Glomus cerebriforme TaxID=658196 RepID=A0A397TMF7_9GLOM|nr:hypothetical protein C1645_815669 [Glomus cerebriforme]
MDSSDFFDHQFVPHEDRRLNLSKSNQPIHCSLEFYWNNDLTVTFSPNSSLEFLSKNAFSSKAFLLIYVISFLIEEFIYNHSLSDIIKLSYLCCLHSVHKSVSPFLAIYPIVSEFLEACFNAGLNTSLLM